MFQAIWGSGVLRRTALMEEVWRFRHHHFVDNYGWEEIRKPDGREIDAFDTTEAVHLVLSLKGKVVAYSRLLPTTKPHLLSDVYPELIGDRPYQTGPKIYEWTRCVSDRDARGPDGTPAANLLLTGVLEFCLMAGIEALVVETHPKLVNLLLETDWEVTPLSAPVDFKGHLVLPIHAETRPKALLKQHELYRFDGRLIDCEASDNNPLDRDQPLKPLPYIEGDYFENHRKHAVGQ